MFTSIRFKLIFSVLAFIVPLIIILFLSNNYAMKVVRNQVAQSNKNLVSLYMNQIDRNLEEADKYLYQQAAQNTDFLSLELSEASHGKQYYSAKIRLSNMINADISNYRTMDLFYIYSVRNSDLFTTTIPGSSFQDRERIYDHIHSMLNEDNEGGGSVNDSDWVVRQVDGRYYLSHFVKTGHVYVGAWVDIGKVMSPLNLIRFGENGKAMLVTDGDAPLTDSGFIRDNQIDLSDKGDAYKLTGTDNRFLVVSDRSLEGNFRLVAVISDEEILQDLPYVERLLQYLPAFSVMLVVLFLIFLRKHILLPVGRIVTAMRRLKHGDFDVRINQQPVSVEFDLMKETFNGMIEQIQELKIDIYEERIRKQNEELKVLKLQINPHFFLNSLHIIFQMAQIKDYAMIQEMSLCLVKHFRFMFRTDLTFVRLGEELEHTRNYIHIQELRFPDHLTFEIDVDDALKDCMIPPFLVQMFVENSIKHALTLDHPLHLSIRIVPERSKEANRLRVSIADSGAGFTVETIENLKKEHEIHKGEHLGIWNVRRRLSLLYDNQADIVFFNQPQGGAVVEILIPFQTSVEPEILVLMQKE